MCSCTFESREAFSDQQMGVVLQLSSTTQCKQHKQIEVNNNEQNWLHTE